MGTMALTTVHRVEKTGAVKMALCTITGSASYATNGDTMPDCSTAGTLGSEGFQSVIGIIQMGATATADCEFRAVYVHSAFSPTAGKVRITNSEDAAPAEVANATDLSASSWQVLIVGS